MYDNAKIGKLCFVKIQEDRVVEGIKKDDLFSFLFLFFIRPNDHTRQTSCNLCTSLSMYPQYKVVG